MTAQIPGGILIRLWFVGLLVIPNAAADEIAVASPAVLTASMKNARPGDVFVLPSGEFADINLLIEGQGTETEPIRIRAADPGRTVLTGLSSLKIAGQYLVIEGLCFRDPDSAVRSLIEFRRDSKNLAHHCRLTNCEVVNERKENPRSTSQWVNLYGTSHQVDHCSFSGKTREGTTLVVWLTAADAGRHQIEFNHFGPRVVLGRNGGETIRVGDSKTSMQQAKCLVTSNLFERCDGEVECISNKSCGNIYRGNTFLEVSGTLTLRHGNACVVEDNVFLGNGVSGSGGIRIIGEDHIVRRNYLENLTGDDARSALCLMMGIPESPAHGYFQVQRARIEDNVFVNCRHAVLIGLNDDNRATLPPIDTHFSGNQLTGSRTALIEARCGLAGIAWAKNSYDGILGIDEQPGLMRDMLPVDRPAGISRSDVGVSWRRQSVR
jgi:poly(beta-D-mannuronate) lyase